MTYTDGVHLVADTEAELHAFADLIGLKRAWYQDRHYDLTARRVAAIAVGAGAKAVTGRKCLEIRKACVTGEVAP